MLHKPLAFAKHLSAHLGCFIHNYLFYKIYKSAWKIPWFNNSAMPLFIRPTHTHKGLQRYYGQFTPPCHQKTEKWQMPQNSGSVFGLWNWLITEIQWPSRSEIHATFSMPSNEPKVLPHHLLHVQQQFDRLLPQNQRLVVSCKVSWRAEWMVCWKEQASKWYLTNQKKRLRHKHSIMIGCLLVKIYSGVGWWLAA